MVPLKHFYITKADVQPYDLPTLSASHFIYHGQGRNLYYDAIIQLVERFFGSRHPKTITACLPAHEQVQKRLLDRYGKATGWRLFLTRFLADLETAQSHSGHQISHK